MTTPLDMDVRLAMLGVLRDTLDASGGGSLRCYTGTPPDGPRADTTETLLCTLPLAVPCGVVSAQGDVAALTLSYCSGLAVTTGVVGWVRLAGGDQLGRLDRLAGVAGQSAAPVLLSESLVRPGGELQLASYVIYL